MPFNLTSENPFLPWLEEEPAALYRALLPQRAGTRFSDYFKGQYGDIYGDYMGKLATMGLTGQEPNLTWLNYLKDFPFLQEWMKLSPWTRGQRNVGKAFWNV